MAIPEDADLERLAEVTLALLSLTAFPGLSYTRAWRVFDWDLLDLLHERGWILDPKGKSMSVVFTPEGTEVARAAFARYFTRRR